MDALWVLPDLLPGPWGYFWKEIAQRFGGQIIAKSPQPWLTLLCLITCGYRSQNYRRSRFP